MSDLRLFALAALTSTLLLGQKYDIHLTSRNSVGDVFLYAAEGTKSQHLSIAGQIMKQEEISAECQATAEVLDVDASGEPVRVAFTISKLTKSENGGTSEVLKPGTVLIVDGRAEDAVSLKDGKISEEARKAFGVIYTPHRPDSVTDDDIFGTKEQKAFGESWPINAILASEDLKKSGIEVSPEHLKGRTELVGKGRIDEIDCLRVRAEIMASGVGMKDLPAGAIIDDVTVQASFDACLPPSGTSSRKTMQMTFNARFTFNGSTMDFVGKQKSSDRWKALRK